jgi:hypothetical protein
MTQQPIPPCGPDPAADPWTEPRHDDQQDTRICPRCGAIVITGCTAEMQLIDVSPCSPHLAHVCEDEHVKDRAELAFHRGRLQRVADSDAEDDEVRQDARWALVQADAARYQRGGR